MPTARELLEQVDALMQRNRAAPETRSPLAPAAPPAAPPETRSPLAPAAPPATPPETRSPLAPAAPPATPPEPRDALAPAALPAAPEKAPRPADAPAVEGAHPTEQPSAAEPSELGSALSVEVPGDGYAAHVGSPEARLDEAIARHATPGDERAPLRREPASTVDDDIPVLTDVANEDWAYDPPAITDAGVSVDVDATDDEPRRVARPDTDPDQPRAIDALATPVPVLVHTVIDAEAASVPPVPVVDHEPAAARAPAGDGIDALAALPAEAPSAPPEPPPLARDDPRWQEIAEAVRIEVLQGIDLFTDTGLQRRLEEQLEPVVARASAELLDAINRHVGDIVRDHVAEAIERAIERRRNLQ